MRCVTLLPTRELCAQVTQVFRELSAACSNLVKVLDLGIEVDSGSDELERLLRTNPDVVVTTPVRLLGFLKKSQLNLQICFESLVVDEAGTHRSSLFSHPVSYHVRRNSPTLP